MGPPTIKGVNRDSAVWFFWDLSLVFNLALSTIVKKIYKLSGVFINKGKRIDHFT